MKTALGVEADGSFTKTPAHARITLTPTQYARLVSRERSPEPVEPQPGGDQPHRFLPRPESGTQEETAFLAEIAVSEDQAEKEQEARDLQEAIALSEEESAARVADETLVSLTETEDESTTTMETHIELVESQTGPAPHRTRRCHTLSPL